MEGFRPAPTWFGPAMWVVAMDGTQPPKSWGAKVDGQFFGFRFRTGSCRSGGNCDPRRPGVSALGSRRTGPGRQLVVYQRRTAVRRFFRQQHGRMGFCNGEADSRLSEEIARRTGQDCYKRRHPVQARVAQPPRNARPPTGVTAPAQRTSNIATAYRLPLNRTIPKQNNHPARLSPASIV